MIFLVDPEQKQQKRLEAQWEQLFQYVKQHHYTGYDVFDGLNSRRFQNTFLYQSAAFRLALLQFCKRSPWNFRKWLDIPPTFDASGGAFFLMGLLNRFQATQQPHYKQEADLLFQQLQQLKLNRKIGYGWGYSWDWQARAFFASKSIPNLISSIYVGKAMWRYYQTTQTPQALQLAVGVAEFILHEMILHESDTTLCFRYIPEKSTEVHNANLKAAAYLSLLKDYLPTTHHVEEKIKKAAQFSINAIHPSGFWSYGTQPFHGWMDNFHTAYNIEALLEIGQNLQTNAYESIINRVLNYYFNYLFTATGTPQYYSHSLYPIDIHVLAEILILFSHLKRSELSLELSHTERIEQNILGLLNQFQDSSGYFYYLKTAQGWNKIPYMRWCQGKTFYALSEALQCIQPITENIKPPQKSLLASL